MLYATGFWIQPNCLAAIFECLGILFLKCVGMPGQCEGIGAFWIKTDRFRKVRDGLIEVAFLSIDISAAHIRIGIFRGEFDGLVEDRDRAVEVSLFAEALRRGRATLSTCDLFRKADSADSGRTADMNAGCERGV